MSGKSLLLELALSSLLAFTGPSDWKILQEEQPAVTVAAVDWQILAGYPDWLIVADCDCGDCKTYADAYKEAKRTGKGVLVSVGQTTAREKELREQAKRDGRLFAIATTKDGFEKGVHRLFMHKGELCFEPEKRIEPKPLRSIPAGPYRVIEVGGIAPRVDP